MPLKSKYMFHYYLTEGSEFSPQSPWTFRGGSEGTGLFQFTFSATLRRQAGEPRVVTGHIGEEKIWRLQRGPEQQCSGIYRHSKHSRKIHP